MEVNFLPGLDLISKKFPANETRLFLSSKLMKDEIY